MDGRALVVSGVDGKVEDGKVEDGKVSVSGFVSPLRLTNLAIGDTNPLTAA